MRILTCSNSAPRLASEDGALKISPAAPGGLVPILTALIQEVGGRWIFTAPAGPDQKSTHQSLLTGEAPSWQALPIDERLIDQQRESISIRTLLWLFHYLHDTSTQPSFDDGGLSAWQAYWKVNEKFADALADAHENAGDEVVLINDFHLMLVPYLFSAKVPERTGRLAYFHHVPWCEPDYFGILPDWMRTQILESLLRCDFVGFHCERWGNAFLACCDRFLPAASVASHTVVYQDHETLVTTAPGPIDASVLEELSRQPATEEWQDRLTRRAGGRRIITRVDRLDLWKNLLRGFSAYEMLLRRNPGLADDFWFCAIVTPPRLRTDRHKRYEAQCKDAAKRINDRFTVDREAVSLIYPVCAGTERNRAVAALTLGSATLVNPTYDGLNMVAKEAVVVNPRAHLLLSTNAGAFTQLAPAVIPIQPFDLLSTADSLQRAMENQDSRTADPIEACAGSLRAEGPAAWIQAILGRPRHCDT
jgi:trehalose 6-phosphate synthase